MVEKVAEKAHPSRDSLIKAKNMENEKNESQQFLDELGIKTPPEMEVFKGPEEAPEEGANHQESQEEQQEEEMKLKNRRERRLANRLRAEREANIALNARLQGISEAQKLREETAEAEFLKLVDPIYGKTDEKGNPDPGRIEATSLLKRAIKGAYESAKKEAVAEALRAIEESRQNDSQELSAEEDRLDDMMDEVEETYPSINFSSKKDREGFLDLMEEASPKDEDGNIIEYADPITVAKLYISQRDKTPSRAKELAARSGTRSGSSEGATGQSDPFFSQLKELGLLD